MFYDSMENPKMQKNRNFYPIASKFGTQVGLVNKQVKYEIELCGSHRDPWGAHKKNNYMLNLNKFSTTRPILELEVSLDRAYSHP